MKKYLEVEKRAVLLHSQFETTNGANAEEFFKYETNEKKINEKFLRKNLEV